VEVIGFSRHAFLWAKDNGTGDTPAFLAIPTGGGDDCEASSSAAQKIILPKNSARSFGSETKITNHRHQCAEKGEQR
jgi:hypothetical protein